MHNSLKISVQNELQRNNIVPEKILGQNFLIDPLVVEKIARNAHLKNIGTVVEVGTGLGTITQALARNAQQVISVEKSLRLCAVAKQNLEQHANVQVVCGDILRYAPPNAEYALVGAPPYYLTARLFRTFLQIAQTPPVAVVLLIQKQVAQKIIQTAPNATVLSVAVQVYGTPRIECVVPQNAFLPQPTVQSALLVVSNIQKPAVDETMFFKVLNSGFAHPRKTLLNNLTATFRHTNLQTLLAQNNIDPHGRAQTLVPRQWIQLTKALCIKQ